MTPCRLAPLFAALALAACQPADTVAPESAGPAPSRLPGGVWLLSMLVITTGYLLRRERPRPASVASGDRPAI